MHFVKPLWLTHGGDKRDHEVYSCHVSPDGKRLVTAAGDGHVRIWSTEAIYNHLDSTAKDTPKQLASLSSHSGTIHSVRFSGNNKYLASGADDKLVCIYELIPGAPPAHTAAFGSTEPPPVENWRVHRRLIGHDNDVQDLGWSYDSSILVSVGLDSKVVVWSGYNFEKLKTLSQHQSHVKGITFDPANKYFATASDDRSIKIFRFTPPPAGATAQDQVNNFTLEVTVSKPFGASPLTTYFRRPSWSPDGAHIAAANAVNGPVSSSAIINRGTWDSDINLIGHEAPVEVCAFSPRLFAQEPPEDYVKNPRLDRHEQPLQQHIHTLVACAGQDKTLSVWNTSFPRPFVVTHELAAKSISDVSWAPDGERLFYTSLDGTIAAAVFEKGELGFPVSLVENEKTLQKFGGGRGRLGLVEGTDELLLEEQSKAGENSTKPQTNGVQPAPAQVNGTSSKAVDGTSEITTIAAATAAALTNGANTTGTATPAEPAAAVSTNGTAADDAPAAPAVTTEIPAAAPADARVERLKQRVTIGKNGKKRIMPMLVSLGTNSSDSASLPTSNLVSVPLRQNPALDTPHAIVDLSKPYDGLPKGGLATLLLGTKRKFAEIEGDEERGTEKRLQSVATGTSAAIVINEPNGIVPPTPSSRPTELETPEVLRPAIISPATSVSSIRLAVPMVRSAIYRPLDRRMPVPTANSSTTAGDLTAPSQPPPTNVPGGAIIFEARNPVGPTRTGRGVDRDPARITLTKGGYIQWQDYLPRPVLQTTGNKHFWIAACEDGSVHVWTPAGRRVLNALVLDAQPVILDCRGWWLLCITSTGLVHVWNLKTLRAAHAPVSLAPVLDAAIHSMGPHLSGGPSVVWARLNSQGVVVVAMSNGEGYAYNADMAIWQRLSEPWWAIGSQYWNSVDTSSNIASSGGKGGDDEDELAAENLSAGVVPLLERNTTNQFLLKGRAYALQRLMKVLLNAEGWEGLESGISVAHLENRVAAAMMLGARQEFRGFLKMYAKRLGAESLKGKVEELLRSLMGHYFVSDEEDPPSEALKDEGRGWQSRHEMLLGWKREELLKEVVLILGKYRELQRITVSYARVIEAVGSVGHDGEDTSMIE